MALFQAFDISASGMTAQRFRTDIIAENVELWTMPMVHVLNVEIRILSERKRTF